MLAYDKKALVRDTLEENFGHITILFKLAYFTTKFCQLHWPKQKFTWTSFDIS